MNHTIFLKGDTPFWLTIYLIQYHNCWKLPRKCLFYIFWQFPIPLLTLNATEMGPFFAWILPLLSRMLRPFFPLNLFVYLKENAEILQKKLFFPFLAIFNLNFGQKNHTLFSFFNWNHQKVLKLFTLHKKIWRSITNLDVKDKNI